MQKKEVLKTTESKKKKVKKKKPVVLRQTHLILPFLSIKDNHILLKDGVMDIMQIKAKDLYSMNDEDLEFLMLSETRFLRSFQDDYKEVILNFPANASSQRAYWLKKRQETDDPFRLGYIDRKLFEFDFLEKERTNREYFIFIYAKDIDTLENRRQALVRARQQSFPVFKITKQKKMNVLFLMNNQNTKLPRKGD